MSPIKRSVIQRGKPLTTKNPLKITKGPAVLGNKKKREITDTKEIREQYLAEHPHCEIGYVLSLSESEVVRKLYRSTCTGVSACVHERKKRSAGGSLVDPVNLMASCFPCNSMVEDHPSLAKNLGLTVQAWQNPADIQVERY